VTTVILAGPQGTGKSLKAPDLARQLGCAGIVEEWWPGSRLQPGHLHLTHAEVDVLPPGVRLVRVEQLQQ
jgi:MoxR-like ATPase